MNTWTCRAIEDLHEIDQAVELEIAIWGLDPKDAVPANLLHAMTRTGSLLVGAFDKDQMIGIAFAFPAPQETNKRIWSHMAGVLPDYQGSGVGFALKQFQRIWAIEHGYTTMSWTYDPLQRGNANFNLHLLGAIAQTYHVNFYGQMNDGINAGLPSDRVEVVWKLRDKKVARLAASKPGEITGVSNAPYLLESSSGQEPITQSANLDDRVHQYLAEIPSSLNRLKETNPQIALAWRFALRSTMQAAFAKGYSATDFVTTTEGRSAYVLSGTTAWYLYVVKCKDQTFYTGISPDVPKRVRVHNLGKGAAYTANRRPVQLIGGWKFNSRSAASKAELAFKKLNKASKIAMLQKEKVFAETEFLPGEYFDQTTE